MNIAVWKQLKFYWRISYDEAVECFIKMIIDVIHLAYASAAAGAYLLSYWD